jgi:phage terminase large subunit-like protein
MDADRLLELSEGFLPWCSLFGLDLFDWQREDFGEATRREGGRFIHPLAAICVPRGDGKSFGSAAVGVWRLTAAPPPQEILSVALDTDGAKITLDHAKRIARGHPDLLAALEPRADSIIVPSTGSRWIVRSRDHIASRGLHPDVVLYDEVGWAKDDELWASLLAAQASVPDPFFLVTSTVGKKRSGPLWRIKKLAEAEAKA